MRIPVTGGTGSAGLWICAELAAQGHKPIVFSRYKVDFPFEMVQGDICSRDDLDHAFSLGVDAVIHAAAAKRSQPTLEIIRTNLFGTQQLLDCCCANGVQFVKLISSTEACQSGGGYESYGASKYLMEQLALEHTDRLNVACLRIPTILGSSGSLYVYWMERIRKGEDVELYTYDAKPKHKFFVTLKEAGRLCGDIDNLEFGQVTFPQARVFNARTLAEVLTQGTSSGIVESPHPGLHYEFLDESYSSLAVSPLGHAELEQVLGELDTQGWRLPEISSLELKAGIERPWKAMTG